MSLIPTFGNTPFQIKWFIILYILTIIPCWVSLFYIVRSAIHNQKMRFLLWSLILFFLLALPYTFVLATMKSVHWIYWVVTFVIIFFIYIQLYKKHKSNNSNWFWDWYAKRYDTLLHFTPYTGLINDLVSEINTQDIQSLEVLEIGCGTGNIASLLVGKSKINYTGIDSSENMLNIARKKIGENTSFKFIKHDVDIYDFITQKKFDVVVINNVLYALKNHVKVIYNLKNLVNSNGKIIISEPLRNSSLIYLSYTFIKKGGFSAVVKLVAHLPSFIILFTANIVITQIEHIKKRNFFDVKELTQLLCEHGLYIVSTRSVYEQQNIMLVAKPVTQ